MTPVAYLPQPKRQLDQVREVICYKHCSLKTKQAYLYWVRFFVRLHGRNELTPVTWAALRSHSF